MSERLRFALPDSDRHLSVAEVDRRIQQLQNRVPPVKSKAPAKYIPLVTSSQNDAKDETSPQVSSRSVCYQRTAMLFAFNVFIEKIVIHVFAMLSGE